jgi:tRNA threonylcarbamoyladenosine biosynthesis protein TsaE
METLHIETVEELDGVAIIALGKLCTIYNEGKTPVLAISGDLGAGKTTFMQAFAKQLGITESVISPTYVIMKRYVVPEEDVEVFKTLVHMDVYRIDDVSEMSPLRFEEVLAEEGSVVCIEWAEKIMELLPPHTLSMNIESTGENSREITFSNHA